MTKYRVLEIFKNEELSFDFSGEYIGIEELDKDFLTLESIIKKTTAKNDEILAKKVKAGVFTGLMCKQPSDGNLSHRRIYVYKKDFKYVMDKFNENTIDFDTFLDSLIELNFQSINPIKAKDIFQKMDMFIVNPLNRRERRLNKAKAEDYKSKFIKVNKKYNSYEWVEKEIEQKCLGLETYLREEGKHLAAFFNKRNFKVLEFNSNYNFSGKQMYSTEGSLTFINEFINNCVSYIKGNDQFFRTFDSLIREDLNNLYYTYDEFNQLLYEIGEELPTKNNKFQLFQRYRLNIIRFKPLRSPLQFFFRKEEVDKLIAESKNFINVEEFREDLTELTDSKINVRFLKSRNIKLYKSPTTLFKERSICIKQADLSTLKEQLICENKIKSAKGIYSLYKIKLDIEKIELKNIDLINKFDEYVLGRSNGSKMKEFKRMAIVYTDVCKILNDNIDSNIMHLPLDRKIDKAKHLLQLSLDVSGDICKYMRAFLKASLIPDVDLMIAKEKIIKDEIDKYNDDDFTTLLVSILDILDDPSKFKKLLYDRTSSSAILYVLIHFVFAWRKTDILEQLPIPNLKLLGYDDGLKFLEDIKNDRFKFEEYHGEKICKDVTEYVYRMNLEANKNYQQLEASIPANIYKYLGLLFCICEGNRQYSEKNKRKRQNTKNLISPGCVKSKYINKTFLSFGVDIVDILGKTFNNHRGTKSFFSVLGEHFNELEMCVLKAVKELRSHKENGESISKTGNKYYLQKDISKATVEIFAKEAMGSVKDYILKLTDANYELLDDEKQIERFKSLKLKNIDIEKIHKSLYETTIVLEEFFKSFNGNKELVQMFLRELLYGKAYAKHTNCKCLLKAKINADNNIIFLEANANKVQIVCPFRTDSCIGCSYLVASRLFIYEFKELLYNFFIQFENLSDIESQKLYAIIFKKKYTPLLSAFKEELGDHIFEKVLNEKQYKSFSKQIAKIKAFEKVEK